MLGPFFFKKYIKHECHNRYQKNTLFFKIVSKSDAKSIPKSVDFQFYQERVVL